MLKFNLNALIVDSKIHQKQLNWSLSVVPIILRSLFLSRSLLFLRYCSLFIWQAVNKKRINYLEESEICKLDTLFSDSESKPPIDVLNVFMWRNMSWFIVYQIFISLPTGATFWNIFIFTVLPLTEFWFHICSQKRIQRIHSVYTSAVRTFCTCILSTWAFICVHFYHDA